MKKITAYPDMQQAMKSLDNGGRFYNLFAKANNGIITEAELGKVVGILNDKQKMVLYLELSLAGLSHGMKRILIQRLTPDLQEHYEKYKPQALLLSEAAAKGVCGGNAILTGIPKLTDTTKKLNGFIIIPMMAGKTMTMMMIPILEKYEVYELRDEEHAEVFFIAHAKGEPHLPEEKMILAGVIKETKADKKGEGEGHKFLDASYFMLA